MPLRHLFIKYFSVLNLNAPNKQITSLPPFHIVNCEGSSLILFSSFQEESLNFWFWQIAWKFSGNCLKNDNCYIHCPFWALLTYSHVMTWIDNTENCFSLQFALCGRLGSMWICLLECWKVPLKWCEKNPILRIMLPDFFQFLPVC